MHMYVHIYTYQDPKARLEDPCLLAQLWEGTGLQKAPRDDALNLKVEASSGTRCTSKDGCFFGGGRGGEGISGDWLSGPLVDSEVGLTA